MRGIALGGLPREPEPAWPCRAKPPEQWCEARWHGGGHTCLRPPLTFGTYDMRPSPMTLSGPLSESNLEALTAAFAALGLSFSEGVRAVAEMAVAIAPASEPGFSFTINGEELLVPEHPNCRCVAVVDGIADD